MLKPESLRSPSATTDVKPDCPNRQSLTVRLFAAQALDQQARTEPDAYVRCELHVGDRVEKRESQARHSRDPDFSGETLTFDVTLDAEPALSFLR